MPKNDAIELLLPNESKKIDQVQAVLQKLKKSFSFSVVWTQVTQGNNILFTVYINDVRGFYFLGILMAEGDYFSIVVKNIEQ